MTRVASASWQRLPSSRPTRTGRHGVAGVGGSVAVASTLIPSPLGGSSESATPPLPVLSVTRQPGG